MLDENGKLPRIKGALMADAVATTVGAVIGTSTTTTFVESASGVSEGGRTGLTSVTTAILFGLSLFLSAIFLAIPSFATAPALVIVGLYMLTNVTNIDFNDMSEAIPWHASSMPFFWHLRGSLNVITYVATQPDHRKSKERKSACCTGGTVCIEICIFIKIKLGTRFFKKTPSQQPVLFWPMYNLATNCFFVFSPWLLTPSRLRIA